MGIEYKKDGIVVDGNMIPLTTIIRNCRKQEVLEEDLEVLIIEWKPNRNFDGAKEILVAPKENIETILTIIAGRSVYFGEIAGKHSDIHGTIDAEDITVIYDKDDVLEHLLKYGTHDFNHSFLCKLCEQFSDSDKDSGIELGKLLRKQF